MNKYISFSLGLLLFCSSTTSFTMEQQLMQRNNAGKTDSTDVLEAKKEKSFFERTINEIKQEKCPQCLDTLEINKGTTTIPKCGHALHSFCFEKLKINNYKHCIVCRSSLELYDEIDERDADCCINLIDETAEYITEKIQYGKILAIKRIIEIKAEPLTWENFEEETNFFLELLRSNRMDY